MGNVYGIGEQTCVLTSHKVPHGLACCPEGNRRRRPPGTGGHWHLPHSQGCKQYLNQGPSWPHTPWEVGQPWEWRVPYSQRALQDCGKWGDSVVPGTRGGGAGGSLPGVCTSRPLNTQYCAFLCGCYIQKQVCSKADMLSGLAQGIHSHP